MDQAQTLPLHAIGYGVYALPVDVARAYAALATGYLPTLGVVRGEAREITPLGDFDAELHGDTAQLPETQVERSLAKERLVLALHDLPEEQRDVFLLYEEAGLSIDEIASVTGCNRETAKSRFRYAVNKLRNAIEEPR